MKKSSQIVISYTSKLFSDGLETITDRLDGFIVTDKVPYKVDLLESPILKNHIDILVIELGCPRFVDLHIINSIIKDYSSLKILLISNFPKTNLCLEVLNSGISGYLLRSCNKQDFITAINAINEGSNYFCPAITKNIMANKNSSAEDSIIELTGREKEVLKLLVDGRTNIEIAKYLLLSENTVKTHRRNILSKFGVKNLIGMVRYACRANLINHGDDEFCVVCPHFSES